MPNPAGPFHLTDPVLLTFNLTDTGNTPVAASVTPVVTVTLPDGTTATPGPVTTPVVGTYQATYNTTQVGHHTTSWVATGTHPGAGSDSFDVWPVADATILSFADCKAALNIPLTTTQFDDEIRQYNESITAWIEYYCGPVIVATYVDRQPAGGMAMALWRPPIINLLNWPGTSSPMKPVKVYGVAYDLSVLSVDPFSGIVEHTGGLPFFYGPYDVQYQAGRPIIPMGISMAARIILKHLWAIQRGGAAGSFGAGEEETSMEGFGFAVPNRALEILEPHRSPGVAV